MQIVYERCAGLDVHKRTVVVCGAITPDAQDRRCKERRTFSTMTADLLRLRDWLKGLGVTHVAMESTGSFWKPIFNILEGHLEVMIVNAQHLKAVPGRKTDLKDAEWIADLLRHVYWLLGTSVRIKRWIVTIQKGHAACQNRADLLE